MPQPQEMSHPQSQSPPDAPDVLRPAPSRVSPRRGQRSRANYPRRRALMACETCRRRKIKCDNNRPTCGACEELDIACVFRDPKGDHSSYDLASLEILDRINHVAHLLEAQRDTTDFILRSHAYVAAGSPNGSSPRVVHPSSRPRLLSTPGSVSYAEQHTLSRVGEAQADAEGLLESLEFTGSNPGTAEEILNWPVFEGEFEGGFDRSKIESLIFNPYPSHDTPELLHQSSHFIGADSVRNSRPGRGIREEDLLALVNTFLINVHIKNPVLEPDDLKAKARWTAEHGFSWDATSCLVLIVCALASISSSFMPDPVTPELVGGGLTSVDDTPEYSTAEAYYIAAQKRIGLLDNSIETTQCFFLSGVYEMYSLRPAKAWTSFTRACITLQIYFRGQDRHEFLRSKGVVSRLYWSCLKSECEVRIEINLPSSGLANVAHPEAFPTPPNNGETAGNVLSPRHGLMSSHSLEPDLEKIWSYYLSELAVRKIANRIMNCFYKDGEHSWLTMPLDRMIRVAEELELQITQWFENLPSTLGSTPGASETHNKLATEELRFVLHARLFDFRERIYRPFLYLAIHHRAEDPIQQRLSPYVQRCVEACVACLLRGTPRHRHHGTWYENRGMFMKSLLIIAAVKSAKMPVSSLWHRGVGLTVAGFEFWEREAPDLKEARLVLQKLLEDFT